METNSLLICPSLKPLICNLLKSGRHVTRQTRVSLAPGGGKMRDPGNEVTCPVDALTRPNHLTRPPKVLVGVPLLARATHSRFSGLHGCYTKRHQPVVAKLFIDSVYREQNASHFDSFHRAIITTLNSATPLRHAQKIFHPQHGLSSS